MLRISATAVEQFRLFHSGDWMSEEELVASILKKEVPTWQMRAGTAWDGLLGLDDLPDSEDGLVRAGEFFFDYGDVRQARAALPIGGVGQVKVTLDVPTLAGPVTLVCKCDRLIGSGLIDYKAKFSPWEPAYLEPSLQWRLYLWAFEASVFQYRVYQFAEGKIPGLLTLKEAASLRFWPYEGMQDECQEWIERFVSWANMRGLTQHLQARAA